MLNQIKEKLFNIDKKGNILQWTIYTEGPEVVICRGREGMKLVETRTTSLAKSVGKKNETTPEQQAVLEATSKHAKQIKRGYTPNKGEVGCTVNLAPLAKKYQDSSKHVNWEEGAVVLTKYDGVRCTMFLKDNGEVLFQSRGGESYPVIQEIADELKVSFFNYNPKLVIDGELYCHGMFLEDITSAVKKHNEDTPNLKFVMFDCYDPDYPDVVYENRLERVKHAVVLKRPEYLSCAVYSVMYTEEGMVGLHDILVAGGYEGVVIRDPKGIFKFNQRDVSFIKYKVRHRAEYETVRPIEAKNGSVKIECVTSNGKTFSPPMLGTIEHQRKVLEDWGQYNTGFGTVEYEAISKYGIPAKAKFVSFRDCDEYGEPTI